MIARNLFVVFVSIGLCTTGAWGQPLRHDHAPLVLHVACGGLGRSACVKVVPRLAGQSSRSGIDLKPEGSGRVVDTAAAVCEGQADAAIVQRDAIALTDRQPGCQGRYDIVGNPLYPYYALLIVRADAPFRQLSDMARKTNAPGNGRRRLIMAGAEGTGGQITLAALMRSSPELRGAVSVVAGDLDVGLERVAAGAVDGFFMVEPLDSDMIDRVRRAVDAHRKPLYVFIDIRPAPEFFNNAGGKPLCLYRLTALDFGGADPVTTISMDAVMVLGRTFVGAHAKGGPRVPDALTSAIEAAGPVILADMKSPADWRPASASCK